MGTMRVRTTVIGLLVTIPLLVCLLTIPALALQNPAAVYCQALGYSYSVESTELGEVGKCQLPDNQTVDAWEFLRGEVGLEWSYCALEGYEAKHVEDSEICADCTVCVLPDETEIEVTQLMGLSFEETVCGDGACAFPENSETCPEDCPPPTPVFGGTVCGDGTCAFPESYNTCPEDCPSPTAISWSLVGGIIAAVVVIGLAITYFVARRRGAPAS